MKLLQADVSQLRIRIKALQETVEMLRARNVQLLAEKDEVCARMRILKNQNQQGCIGKHLKKQQFNRFHDDEHSWIILAENTTNETSEHEGDTFGSTVRVYLDELESLRLISLFFF